jgi:hypothetical protein
MSQPGATSPSVTDAPTLTSTLELAVVEALRAPSTLNTQPWAFALHADGVSLYADRTRRLASIDPDDRALTIACGAALHHLRTALGRFGWRTHTTLLPDAAQPDLMARVELVEQAEVAPEVVPLFEAIGERRSNRRPFLQMPVPEEVVQKLRAAATVEGAALEAVDDPEAQAKLIELVMEGERLQWADPKFRAELARWVRSPDGDARDGIVLDDHTGGNLETLAARWAIRLLDRGVASAHHNRDLAEASPLLMVLGTDGDTPRDWLRAGEALSRVLLVATAEGLSASFLNQPVERPELRYLVRDLVVVDGQAERDMKPQVVLRLGYGPDVGPTARRPLREVLRLA